MESGNETAVHIKKAIDAASDAKARHAIRAGKTWVYVTTGKPIAGPVLMHALGEKTHKLNLVLKPGEFDPADLVEMTGRVFLVEGFSGKRSDDGSYLIELTLIPPLVVDIDMGEVNQ